MSEDPFTGDTERPVVTLFELYGSGAEYVGRRVAEVLSLPFHRELFPSETMEAAEEGRDSRGLMSRVLGLLASAVPPEDGRAVAAAEQRRIDVARQNTQEVEAAARDGGVIVGRDAALVLAGRPASLHVMLTGPVEQRIQRAAKEKGIDGARATKRQQREDQIRVEMSIDFYGHDPRDPNRYHIVLNTGSTDLDTCVEIIAHASRITSGSAVG